MTEFRTSEFNPAALTKRQQIIHRSLSKIELDKSSPFHLISPTIEGSGYTFGWAQFDMAQRPDERESLLNLLKNSKKFDNDTLHGIGRALGQKGESPIV